jgi:hypothetical protein
VVPGLWTVDHPFSCRKVVVVCMPRSHRWHRTVAVPLCHYYIQLQPTRTHRPGSLPVGAGGYPTAAHAESMPTAPPPNPGPVMRKINRGRWAAHCTAVRAFYGLSLSRALHWPQASLPWPGVGTPLGTGEAQAAFSSGLAGQDSQPRVRVAARLGLVRHRHTGRRPQTSAAHGA